MASSGCAASSSGELADEPVVLGVGEDGPVEDVVGVVGGDGSARAARGARPRAASDMRLDYDAARGGAIEM